MREQGRWRTRRQSVLVEAHGAGQSGVAAAVGIGIRRNGHRTSTSKAGGWREYRGEDVGTGGAVHERAERAADSGDVTGVEAYDILGECEGNRGRGRREIDSSLVGGDYDMRRGGVDLQDAGGIAHRAAEIGHAVEHWG